MKNFDSQFLERLSKLTDVNAYLAAMEKLPVKAFDLNTLKVSADRFFGAFGECRPLPFTDGYITDAVGIGKTAYHHAGLIYMQEPSAMLPVEAVDFSGDELALDMCAAPGGKTFQLAKRVKYLVANECNKARASILCSNVERLGLKNTAITSCMPNELEKLGEVFDLILVDAPCSGEGMFRKDDDAIKMWSVAHVKACAQRQRAILESADKLLKSGGKLIYSTCTFSTEEDESVVENFLCEHDYELLQPRPAALLGTEYYSHPFMRRAYPHTGDFEGQFFAVLRKRGGGLASLSLRKEKKDKARARLIDECVGRLLDRTIDSYLVGDAAFSAALPYELGALTIRGGVKLGEIVKGRFEPHHAFFNAFGSEMNPRMEIEGKQLERYLSGGELQGETIGFGAVTFLGAGLGGIKGSDGRLRNLYPKGLRNAPC